MWIVNIALRRPYTFIVAAIFTLLVMPFFLVRMSTMFSADMVAQFLE